MPSYCAVCKKKNNNRKFRFPNPNRPDLSATFDMWLTFVNNAQYKNMPRISVYKSVYVCDLHFKYEDFYLELNKRCLKYFAVPSIYSRSIIPVIPESSSFMDVCAIEMEPSCSNQVASRISRTPIQRRKISKKTISKRKRTNLQRKMTKGANLLANYKFRRILSQMPSNARTFVHCQIREIGKAKKGRRFTTEEKIFGLTLYKQGPKAYRFYRDIFALPSPTTLNKLLKMLPLKVGINPTILEYLTRVSSELGDLDRCCSVLFDEVFIMPGLRYDALQKKIHGFVDNGGEISKKMADHALVFMIRGLLNNWKFPFAYYFVESGTKTVDLVRIIKEVVIALQESNFKVFSLICDQGSNNVAAINYLKEETKRKYFQLNKKYDGCININEHKLFNIYDVPHLLKRIRNNLLTGDLFYKENGSEQKACWQHIEQAYNEDRNKFIRSMPKLTDFHVMKDKIKKMKVKYCTQVFSRSVASQMETLATYAPESVIEGDALHTAKLLLFFDKLFDPLNGNDFCCGGKPLKGAVKLNSEHVKFWRTSINMLKTMYFMKNDKRVVPPSLKNFILTLENTLSLWKLIQEEGFKYLLTRRLNQDPLENFFAAVRSQGRFNSRPTTVQFVSAFKTLLINNMSAKHSLNANCENDRSFSVGDSLRLLLNLEEQQTEISLPFQTVDGIYVPVEPSEVTILTNFKISYFSGYILKKNYTIYKNCDICTEYLICAEPNTFHSLIEKREFQRMRHLKYPSTAFMNFINDIKVRIQAELRYNFNNIPYIFNKLQDIGDNFLSCEAHKDVLLKNIIKGVADILIYKWCNDINNILKGKFKIAASEDDFIKVYAYDKYRKLSRR